MNLSRRRHATSMPQTQDEASQPSGSFGRITDAADAFERDKPCLHKVRRQVKLGSFRNAQGICGVANAANFAATTTKHRSIYANTYRPINSY